MTFIEVSRSVSRALHNEVNEIYISKGILQFAKSLISIFVPIFLYKLGYPLVEIIAFYLIYNLTYWVLVPLGMSLAAKWGIRHAMLYSSPVLILFYYLLRFVEGSTLVFYLAPVVLGIYCMLFWPAYNIHIVKAIDPKRRASQIGLINVIIASTAAVAPFIGGILFDNVSFDVIFWVASILIVISALPLFLSRETYEKIHFSAKDLYHDLFVRRNAFDVVAWFGEGGERELGFLSWSLLVFLAMESDYKGLGALTAVALIITVVVSLYFGPRVDKSKDLRGFTKSTSVLTGLSWILRGLSLKFWHFYATDIFGRGMDAALDLPFASTWLGKAEKDRDMIRYVARRQLGYHGGATLLLLVALLIAYQLTGYDELAVRYSIFAAGFFALLRMFMTKK